MNIRYTTQGKERKKLAQALEALISMPVCYEAAPSFAYTVGGFRIDRNSVLTGADNRALVSELELQYGFTPAEETYDDEPEAPAEPEAETETGPAKPDKTGLPRLYTLITPRGEIYIAEEFTTPDEAAAEGYGEAFSTALGTVYSYGDSLTFALVTSRKAGDWDATKMGRDFREAAPAAPEAPAEPESRTYKAELSDPDCPDRMEVFSAEDDADAVRQAREFCEGEVVLLELDELDENYDVVRGVDLTQYPNGLSIEVPLTGFDPAKLDNLTKLVAGKETLIKMALGVDALPIQVKERSILFPWFPYTEDGDTVLAYSQLITAICRTALEKQRVNAQPKEDYPNPRFTMRCWLISLGLVGDDYRLIRKLMCAIPGNGAWSKGTDPRKAAAQEKAEAMADAELLFEVNKLLETETAGEADLPGGGEEGADNA